MIRRSITRRLVFLFFMVGLSCLAIAGIYSYRQAKEAILSRALDQLTSIRVIKKRQIQSFFNERYNNINFFADDKRVKALFERIPCDGKSIREEEISAETIGFMSFGISNIFFVKQNADSSLVIYTKDTAFHRYKGDKVTCDMLNKLYNDLTNKYEPLIIDFRKRFKNDNEPVCLLGKNVFNKNNVKLGALIFQIPIKEINSIMLEDSRQNGLGESGEIYLVGNDFMMRSNSRFIKNSVLNTKVKTTSAINAFADEIGSAIIDDYRTISVLSSYDKAEIKGLDWVIIAEIDYKEAMIPITSIRNDILFISLLISIFLFSFASIISRSISQPIIALKKAAENIGEGKLGITVTAKSKDEIGVLTNAFNDMSLQLKDEKEKRMTALYDGQEIERQRISRELHDGIGQKLIAIKLELESTNKLDSDATRVVIDEVKMNFARTIEEIRIISNNLAPNILKDSGVEVAINNLCDSLKRMTGFNIEFSTYGDLLADDNRAKTYLYRIAQEAITNSIKHSNSNKIEVQLHGIKDSVILIIEDNGAGFKPNPDIFSKGNGLYNMKERAELLGGTMVIESEPGHGTTVRIKIPKLRNEKNQNNIA